MPICPKCEDENPQLGAKCPRDGFYYVHDDAYEMAQHDPRIGTMSVDKYVIIGRISKGGMGAVYLAMQLPVEREVAFKVLRTEMEGSDKSRDRFIREARAVSKLTHPNIITLYDFGFDENNHPYMAMEYAPGQDLSKWLKRDDLTIERILHVTRQLLGALDAAHLQGIVHRDLKPENMIVTETSRDRDFVKLLDFGIARMINETSTRGLTREGEVFGTPHYMAPEQAQGAKEVGPAADVYAVGIILYELITGETPFDAPTPLAVLLMHINEALPTIKARPGIKLTEGLVAFVERATAKDPAERFANAGEMISALDQLITQSGLHTTGAFMGVALADHSGDFSHPSTIQTSPISNEESHAPTLTSSPLSNDASTARPDMPYSDVSVHDPDPSALISQAEVAAALTPSDTSSDDWDSESPVDPPGSNKTIFVALAAVLLLVALAGGIIAVLTSDSGGEDTTTQTQEDTSSKEVAQKEELTSPEKETPPPTEEPVKETPPTTDTPPSTDTAPPETDAPPQEDIGAVDPTTPATEDKTPEVDATPKKDPVVTKRPRKERPKKTTPREDPPKKDVTEKPPEEKKPIKKDTWGAPTQEQKEKFKKNDKW